MNKSPLAKIGRGEWAGRTSDGGVIAFGFRFTHTCDLFGSALHAYPVTVLATHELPGRGDTARAVNTIVAEVPVGKACKVVEARKVGSAALRRLEVREKVKAYMAERGLTFITRDFA